jgi:hypothetical protein
MPDNFPSPNPPSCGSYVACQRQYIDSIQAVNKSYNDLLKSQLDPQDDAYIKLQANYTSAVNKMKAAIASFELFLSQNSNDRSSSYSQADYVKIQSMRLELAEQSDMLKSRYGAPKEYGAANNLYDEYRSNYNTMKYAFIIACLIATVLLFFLFRMI